VLSSVVEILKQMELEQLITTENFLIAKKFDIYVGVPAKLDEVYFVKFGSRPKTCNEIGKLPWLAPWSRLSLVKTLLKSTRIMKKVDDFSVIRFQGKLRLPVSARQIGDNRYALKYLEGLGVMYFPMVRGLEPRARGRQQTMLERLGTGRVFRIIEELSEETVKEE
jgi:hypothetical protein